MQRVVVQIHVLSCAGCKQIIEQQLNQYKGMISAKVFPQLGKIRVEFDESSVTVNQIKEMITNLGYPIHSIKSNEEDMK